MGPSPAGFRAERCRSRKGPRAAWARSSPAFCGDFKADVFCLPLLRPARLTALGVRLAWPPTSPFAGSRARVLPLRALRAEGEIGLYVFRQRSIAKVKSPHSFRNAGFSLTA